MLRVCKEIRIFPIVDLDANKTELISSVIGYFKQKNNIEIVSTEYEFQKGDNKMLIIRQRNDTYMKFKKMIAYGTARWYIIDKERHLR